MPEFTTEEVASILDREGLDAITNYMSGESIKDRKLAKLWNNARDAIIKLEEFLYPDGIDAWHDQEPPWDILEEDDGP